MKRETLTFKRVSASAGGFPPVHNLSFCLLEGEFMGLIGISGSGKWTIANLLTGEAKLESGEILVCGEQFTATNLNAAQRRGVFCMLFKSNLIGSMSIAENLFLNRRVKRQFSVVRDRVINTETQSILDDYGIDLCSGDLVAGLTPSMKCIIELIKFHVFGAKVVLMYDVMKESDLSEQRLLLRVVQRLTCEGASILFLTNSYDDWMSQFDRLLVMSAEGRAVRTLYRGEYAKRQVDKYLVGRDYRGYTVHGQRAPGKTVLAAEGLCAGSYRNISFKLRSGEVLGLLDGEPGIADCIPYSLFGRCRYSGKLYVCGQRAHINSSSDALRLGIGLLPSDLRESYFADLDACSNVAVLFQNRLCTLPGIISSKKLRVLENDSAQLIALLKAKYPSGYKDGMQEVLSRFSLFPFRAVLVMRPSLQNDIIKTRMIFDYIESASARGCGVIVLSSKPDELKLVCNRILALSATGIVAELNAREL